MVKASLSYPVVEYGFDMARAAVCSAMVKALLHKVVRDSCRSKQRRAPRMYRVLIAIAKHDTARAAVSPWRKRCVSKRRMPWCHGERLKRHGESAMMKAESVLAFRLLRTRCFPRVSKCHGKSIVTARAAISKRRSESVESVVSLLFFLG